MKSKLKLLLVLLIIGQTTFAQQKLPLIKANSKKVDIKDENSFKKASWNISPELKPDLYITANKNKKVTFYTDLDSISFIVKPNKQYDFIILLNNKDSALTRIVFVPTPLETLKKADKYNLEDKRVIPNFTYQSSDNPNLVLLRKTLKLDSIAGAGNEVSQILNLLHWIHNLIPHDGRNGNPKIKNALNMISTCTKEKRALDCRGLAMALNECYLSMGYKSRYVFCLPKDSLGTDYDSHVINMVYSKSHNKWLWIDPTFYAYVMNEKGELQSIEEVRERLINNLPLIINTDANRNQVSPVMKEWYLNEYMAKNLYKLECSVSSEYNTETKEKGKTISYIQLLPLDDFRQFPDKEEIKDKATETKVIRYKTNNLNLFWQKP